MAYPQIGSAPAKLSFAKIAAMPAPNTILNNNNKLRKEVRSPKPNNSNVQLDPWKVKNAEIRTVLNKSAIEGSTSPVVPEVIIPLQKLSLAETAADSAHSDQNVDSGDSYEEDQSQISTSSLNKPHSFDTKSLASVTTFAMDDKESIRPDDSASVRAADEDVSHVGLSRNSSFQQEYEPAPKQSKSFSTSVTIPGRRFPTLANPPRFGTLPISPVIECQDTQLVKTIVPLVSLDSPIDPTPVIHAEPDEKLMEALSSMQNRLMLLKMEEKLLAFIADDTTDILDVAAENSFTRLLAHKLADYYSLAHQVSDDTLSVKIFGSNSRLLPPPLVQLAKTIPVGSSTGPSAIAVKIMRREQLGGRQSSAGNSTAPSSSVPSKATSENGLEVQSDDCLLSPTESTPNRDKSKLTREEREAQYKAVRERIFSDFQETMPSENVSTGENSASMSRSSSSSGKKKLRKPKQPKDDSFEARSAYYSNHLPIATQYNPLYFEPSMANNYAISPSGFEQDMYGATPTQSFSGFDTNLQFPVMQGFAPHVMQQYGNGDWQSMQAMQNGYFMYPQAIPFQQQSSNVMSPNGQTLQQGQQLHSVPEWYNNQYQNHMNYPHSSQSSQFLPQHATTQRSHNQANGYGQPFNPGYTINPVYSGHTPTKPQKSLFNPQTRSFVPSNTEGRAGNRPVKTKNVGRQNINANQYGSVSIGNGLHSTSKEDSLKKKYGTPASLPKKPPPSEVKATSEVNGSSDNSQTLTPPLEDSKIQVMATNKVSNIE